MFNLKLMGWWEAICISHMSFLETGNIKRSTGKTRNFNTRTGIKEITIPPTWKTQTAVLC